jgi:Uma2 family endonuclease
MSTATLRRPKTPRSAAASTPPTDPFDSVQRFTLSQYQEMIDTGILGEKDRCHLINGVIRKKMSKSAPHIGTTGKLNKRLSRLLPDEFVLLPEPAVQFPHSDSEPEPDFVVTAGPDTRFDEAKPTARDVLLVIEVADTSLASDRGEMLRMYAGGKVPVYWIVNVREGIVEVYTDPRGGRNPTYRTRTDYAAGDSVPVVLGGKRVGEIAVSDILAGGN